LFSKRGLLYLGLFTILVGMTAVVACKMVWPAILRGIGSSDIKKVGAIRVDPNNERTIMSSDEIENSTWTNPMGGAGKWVYYYWETANTTNNLDTILYPHDPNTTVAYHWLLRNITGDITLYVRYSLLPTLEATQSGLFLGLKPITPEIFDPFYPPVVYGCDDGRIVFFGVYSKNGPTNFTLSWEVEPDTDFRPGAGTDYDGEARGCKEQEDHSDRLIRTLYPIMASFFLFCGCICMAYWGYNKVTNPESELYQIVGDKSVEILNF